MSIMYIYALFLDIYHGAHVNLITARALKDDPQQKYQMMSISQCKNDARQIIASLRNRIWELGVFVFIHK